MEFMNHSMSDRLRLAREFAGYNSARSAALAIGINPSTYGAHENGQNNFKPRDAELYSSAFGVSASWLLTGVPIEPSDRHAQMGMVRAIGRTPADEADDESRLFVDGEFVQPPPISETPIGWRGARDRAEERGAVAASEPRTFADGRESGKIAEIDLVAGMGGGGLAATEISTANGISFQSEVVRAHWEMPSWVLSKLNVRAHNVACFPCQGDSMSPTISDGDVIFIDTRHRVPSPPGIYAIADEFGGVVVKRLEVISKPRDEDVMVRVSSDNPHYRDKELLLNEISILGRYICRVAF